MSTGSLEIQTGGEFTTGTRDVGLAHFVPRETADAYRSTDTRYI
jgi:hypothetical protein